MSGWAVLALCIMFALGIFIAFLPMLCVVIAETQRDEERARNSTGGRNYVDWP